MGRGSDGTAQCHICRRGCCCLCSPRSSTCTSMADSPPDACCSICCRGTKRRSRTHYCSTLERNPWAAGGGRESHGSGGYTRPLQRREGCVAQGISPHPKYRSAYV